MHAQNITKADTRFMVKCSISLACASAKNHETDIRIEFFGEWQMQ